MHSSHIGPEPVWIDDPFSNLDRPLFVDLQVNGIVPPTLPRLSASERARAAIGTAPIDFSNPKLSIEEIELAVAVLEQRGIDYFLPTLVTAAPEWTCLNLTKFAHAMTESWGSAILGVHLEGPFFSMSCRGAHPPAHIVEWADIELFDRYFEASKGTIALVTISPAIRDAPKLIRHVVDRGVVVSLGHHDATTEQIEAAFDAGATGLTHAGNGWAKDTRPGAMKNSEVMTQLLGKGVYVMVIPDGVHIDPDFLRCAHKIVKGREVLASEQPGSHLIFVSDLSPLAGVTHPGTYRVYNHLNVKVEKTGSGVKANPLTGALADLRECYMFARDLKARDGSAVFTEREAMHAAGENALSFIRTPLERLKRAPSRNTLLLAAAKAEPSKENLRFDSGNTPSHPLPRPSRSTAKLS